MCQGLLASWLFNEGIGKVRDHGKARAHGTLTGSSITWSTYLKGYEARYTATSGTSYVGTGNTSTFNFERTQPVTFELMVYIASTTAIDAFGNGNSAGTRGWWVQLNKATSGKVQVYLANTAINAIIIYTTNADLINNAWNHVVVTYDGSSTAAGVKIYINGCSRALTTSTDALSATTQTGVEWTIGRSGASTTGSQSGTRYAWHRIWTRVLTPSEVSNLYSSPFVMFNRSEKLFSDLSSGTIYNASISAGMCAGVSTSAVAAQAASVILDSRQGFTPAASQVTEVSMVIGGRQGVSFIGGLDMSHSVAYGVRAGLSFVGGLSIDDSLTLGSRLGLSSVSAFIYADFATLGARVGLAEAVALTFSDSVSLDTRTGQAVAATLTQEPLLSLPARLGYNQAGNLVISAAIPMVTLQGFSGTGGFILENTVGLGARLGYSETATLDIGAAISLGSRAGLSLTASLTLDTTASLGSRLGYDVDVTVDLGASSALSAGLGLSESVSQFTSAAVTFNASLGAAIVSALEIGGSLSIPVRVGLTHAPGTTLAYPGTLTLLVTGATALSGSASLNDQVTLVLSEQNQITGTLASINQLGNSFTMTTTLTSTETTLP